jgi:UDP:flavonoid glycosyltransferase YjiC (YdhE family)
MIVRSAPHGPLLDGAAVFVTHAGHGSTLRPLMAGVPLLCLPMGRDQHDNAARVSHRGAGLTLPADSRPETIGAAVRQLLEEPRFRTAASALGSVILAETGRGHASTALETLLFDAKNH